MKGIPMSILFYVELLLLLDVYFLPTIAVAARGGNLPPVAVVNFFFGWTFVGWVVALAMAVGTRNKAIPVAVAR